MSSKGVGPLKDLPFIIGCEPINSFKRLFSQNMPPLGQGVFCCHWYIMKMLSSAGYRSQCKTSDSCGRKKIGEKLTYVTLFDENENVDIRYINHLYISYYLMTINNVYVIIQSKVCIYIYILNYIYIYMY